MFTPGSKAGIPVSILSSLEVPPFEVMDDGELLGERVGSTVESLLSLVGVNSGGSQSPEAVLLGAIFAGEWGAGRGLTLETLIGQIQRPNFTKVGVIDLETFVSERSRQGLAMRFNGLLASPGFAAWLEGAPLDIGKMLHRDDGKPRMSIFSIAHLDDAQRMFFVSLLLNQMLGWMRTQRGTSSLRAILYMDEIFGYLPPTANPPSKRPMMTMLKQARAFGVGCLLATQNPVDLDYKALSNIGTWFLGRLQTERDKMRVLDGLEGAAGEQNARFDRREIDRMLSGLGNRIFLMNNVHEDAPVLFHVRWVMSYLTGPLTRGQIKGLMDPKRVEFEGQVAEVAAPVNPMLRGSAVAPVLARPVVGAGVIEVFSRGDVEVYRPYLLREATVHFSLTKARADGYRKVIQANPIMADGIDWDGMIEIDGRELGAEPVAGIGFSELPGYAMNAANYRSAQKDFSDQLYRNEREDIWYCPALKSWGSFGECEVDFRARLAREVRDVELAKLREAAAKRITTIEGRLRTAEGQLANQKASANAAKMQAGVSVQGGILGSLLGRKSGIGTLNRGSASIGKATSAYQRSQNVATTQGRVDSLLKEIEAIREKLEADMTRLAENFDPAALVLEKEQMKPTRSDVKVERVGLLWG